MTILDEFNRDAERVLDRLVDGELLPGERRELLAALDDEPGGWRRCALVFLESQTWRRQLSRAAAEPILAQRAGAVSKSRTKKRALWGGGFLALAASLAVAFLLGTRFSASGAGTGAMGIDGRNAAGAYAEQLPKAAPPDAVPPPTPLAHAAEPKTVPNQQAPWQTVTLTRVGGSGKPIELRVDPAGAAGAPPARERSTLFGRVSRAFEREGWQVDRRQGVVPIDLSDGRQLVVPIEEVDFKSPDFVQF
jgi:hypothetical protein